MNTPYGLEIVDNCMNCKSKREECFCNLSAPVLKAFSAISHQTIYPPGNAFCGRTVAARRVSSVYRKGQALYQFA
jgi:hypothetical protein